MQNKEGYSQLIGLSIIEKVNRSYPVPYPKRLMGIVPSGPTQKIEAEQIERALRCAICRFRWYRRLGSRLDEIIQYKLGVKNGAKDHVKFL